MLHLTFVFLVMPVNMVPRFSAKKAWLGQGHFFGCVVRGWELGVRGAQAEALLLSIWLLVWAVVMSIRWLYPIGFLSFR